MIVMVATAAALLLMTPCRGFLLHRNVDMLFVIPPAFITTGGASLMPILVLLFFRLR